MKKTAKVEGEERLREIKGSQFAIWTTLGGNTPRQRRGKKKRKNRHTRALSVSQSWVATDPSHPPRRKRWDSRLRHVSMHKTAISTRDKRIGRNSKERRKKATGMREYFNPPFFSARPKSSRRW